MKKLLVILSGALVFAKLAAAAITPALTGPPTAAGGNYLWNYQVSVDALEQLVDGSFFTIYDFQGYVPGSITAPAGWTAQVQLVGLTPSTQNPPDNPAIENLTFVYTGATSPDKGPINLAGFSALSTFGGENAGGSFSYQAQKDNGVTDADSGNVTVPILSSGGTIQVTTNLPAATFTITGPATYMGGGTSFSQPNAPPGKYTITYDPFGTDITPPQQTMPLSAAGSVVFSGRYAELGIDISSYAGDISDPMWKAIKNFSTTIGGNLVSPQFVIVDAFGGGGLGEANAHDQLQGAYNATLGIAAYCLLNFEQPDEEDGKWTGAWQVNKAIAAIDKDDKDPSNPLYKHLAFMAIDVERNSQFTIALCKPETGGSQANCVTRIQEAVAAVQAKNITAIIYTNKSDWDAITGLDGSTPNPFSTQDKLALWVYHDDFLPSLLLNGTPPTICTEQPSATTFAWPPFGGWAMRVGKQYDSGCNGEYTFLTGIPVELDLDVFDVSIF